MEIIKSWKPDLMSVFLTAVIVPLGYFLIRILLRHFKHWSGFLLEGMLYWLTRIIRHSMASALTMKRYCRLQLSGGNQYLHVPSRGDVKVQIDKVYVTLTLENPGSDRDSFSHQDILTAGNRLRIMGDPGSGKSSLVKRVFRDECKKALDAPTKSRLPVLLELKNLRIPASISDDGLGGWFYSKLREDAEKTAVYQMGECFDSYAQTAGLLLLLDGLDEVSTTDYQRVQSAILQLGDRLAQLGDRSVVVLTMRTQFHQQIKESFRDGFGTALFLNPFTPSDIYRFLTKWPFKADAEKNVTRIYKELTDRPTLREMCSNPLVLSMYVAEDQASSHSVAPESRTEFYSKVTEELLIRRRQKQIPETIAASAMREQRARVLGKLAYDHLLDSTQPANSLDWTDAIKIVMRELTCTEQEAELKFREIAKETGLISEERERQSLRFIHLTFCEFLAAYEAVQGRENGWPTLLETHRAFQTIGQPQLGTRLGEVIPFACGLLPRVKKYKALDDVSELRDRRLSALCFLETKLYDHPSWSEFVRSERGGILETPEAEWDEEWLRRLHLYNVVNYDANISSSHLPGSAKTEDLAGFFKTLLTKQRDNLNTLLSAYATQDAAAAFRLAEICGLDMAEDFPLIVITKCDQLPFFSLVMEQALREPERIRLWASLLAEAALRSPVVAHWLGKAPSVDSLDSYCNDAERHESWFRYPRLKKTLYGQFLTVAVRHPPPTCMLVRILKNIPAPKIGWDWLLFMLLMVIMMVGFFSAFAPRAVESLTGLDTSNYYYVSLACMLATYMVLVIFVIQNSRRHNIYKTLFQIKSTAEATMISHFSALRDPADTDAELYQLIAKRSWFKQKGANALLQFFFARSRKLYSMDANFRASLLHTGFLDDESLLIK